MNVSEIISSVKHVASENSPKLYLIGGFIAFGASLVLVGYESTKISSIIEEHKKKIDEVNDEIKKIEDNDPEVAEDDYDEHYAKKDKFIITCQTSVEIVKNYIPAICAVTLATFFFLKSYGAWNKKYLAASALAASLSEAFYEYRKRVRDEFGEDVEKKLYFNTDEQVVTTFDGDKEVTETIEVVDADKSRFPIYAKIFDESNPNWSKNPAANYLFLKGMEVRANDIFKRNGVLLLNDVYQILQFDITETGNEVGWFRKHGDQFVDFGLKDPNNERVKAFVDGYEPSVILNFNCTVKKPGDIPRF